MRDLQEKLEGVGLRHQALQIFGVVLADLREDSLDGPKQDEDLGRRRRRHLHAEHPGPEQVDQPYVSGIRRESARYLVRLVPVENVAHGPGQGFELDPEVLPISPTGFGDVVGTLEEARHGLLENVRGRGHDLGADAHRTSG